MMIKNKKTRLLITNIAVYIILFSIFSFTIYKYVAKKQYDNVDSELMITKELMNKPQHENKGDKLKLNPRVTILARDDTGNIIVPSEKNRGNEKNTSDSNDFFVVNIKEIEWKKLNEIFELNIGGYRFRTISFKTDSNTTETMQLLININTEQELLRNLLKILIVGGGFIIIISIAVGWYLTEKSMVPIMQSWKKQQEFVENASHELRTPLTIIQSKLEMMLKEPNARVVDKLDYLSPALSETRRISRMVGNLLTLARADSNATELEKETVNIEKLLLEIIEPYIEIGEQEDKTISFSCNNEKNLICDKGRIQQLLVILLDNALKYTNKGGSIKVVTTIKDNKYIISVEDDGIGIKDENRQKVFERFFREDISRTRESGGSGLGLSIATWIVQQHRGNIKCLKNMPTGTIMKVILPFEK